VRRVDGEGARAIALPNRLLAWTKQQAAELRRLAAARVNSTLDLAHLAEEVESLGTTSFQA
jgi:hypothetical protein